MYNILQSTRIDWKNVIIPRVVEELKWFEDHDIKPTLRTLFYRLISLGVLPNTKSRYKQLSDRCVDARKDGILEWNCFADEGREVLGDFVEEYRTPEEHVQLYINCLKKASLTYEVPKWYNQPHYVEVWIEKAALSATISSFLEGRDVRIVVNRGYSGWSFLYKNCNRLLKVKGSGKEIHILYFGDFDPSGTDMDRHLNEAFHTFHLEEIVDFVRVAVTEDQIKEFGLPHMPDDDETIAKVNNDTRANKFRKKYGKLYAVELDALLAIVPGEFKSIVKGSVDQFFDHGVYQDTMSNHRPELVDRLVHERVRFL